MRTPRVLSIAGSDSSGGAGLQADLKTFAAHGVYGMTAVTALTAQNTRGVFGVHEVGPEFLRAQLVALFDDCPPVATKTGMLASADLIDVVVQSAAGGALGRLVVDPVLVATSGDRLLDEGAEDVLRRELLPLAEIVTPNLPEARVLSGVRAHDAVSADELGERLLDLGACAVLLKGGHGQGARVVDRLYRIDAPTVEFVGERVRGGPFHGTGCSLSAAIATWLARGSSLEVACRRGVSWVRRALETAPRVGAGARPLDHSVPPIDGDGGPRE